MIKRTCTLHSIVFHDNLVSLIIFTVGLYNTSLTVTVSTSLAVTRCFLLFKHISLAFTVSLSVTFIETLPHIHGEICMYIHDLISYPTQTTSQSHSTWSALLVKIVPQIRYLRNFHSRNHSPGRLPNYFR